MFLFGRQLTLTERVEQVWGSEAGIVLRDFILQNQMPSKRVPCQLGHGPVILMSVLSVMCIRMKEWRALGCVKGIRLRSCI